MLLTSVLSSLGLGVSSFFGVFLLRNNKLENRLLAWLLIALSLRITKSIFYIHLELPLTIKNLGLAANLAVGPLLYLYVRSFIRKEQFSRLEVAHFIPSLIYLVFSPILPNGGESHFWIISYSFILVQSFVYVYLSASIVGEKARRKSKDIRWVIDLIACLTIMWLVYALIFLRSIPVYSLGPVTFSITIWRRIGALTPQQHLFTSQKRSKPAHPRMNHAEGQAYFVSIKDLLVKEQLYKQTDLSLSSVAAKMNLLERDISFIINRYGECNFAQFVNGYRIEEAKRLIVENSSKKMIVIAHEAGFNNLSTFNKTFKAITGLTPTEYKKL